MTNRTMRVDIPITGGCTSGVMLSWVIRGFFCAICEVYVGNFPRRKEAHDVVLGMVESAVKHKSITDVEAEKIQKEIASIYNEVFPEHE